MLNTHYKLVIKNLKALDSLKQAVRKSVKNLKIFFSKKNDIYDSEKTFSRFQSIKSFKVSTRRIKVYSKQKGRPNKQFLLLIICFQISALLKYLAIFKFYKNAIQIQKLVTWLIMWTAGNFVPKMATLGQPSTHNYAVICVLSGVISFRFCSVYGRMRSSAYRAMKIFW